MYYKKLSDTSAVHGAAVGCFDGKRTFLVLNHQSKLSVRALETGSGSGEDCTDDPSALKQVASIPTRTQKVFCCSPIDIPSGGLATSGCAFGAKALLLILFIDER